jgi:hypothetical protein
MSLLATFVQQATKLVNAELEDEIRHVTSGIALDFADYKWRTGRIDGLKRLEQIFETALDDINNA